jgi:3'-phosphoadenosine 5'-phosphosulfate sulfotransferase (PAPS reductase)/FAD synthetase
MDLDLNAYDYVLVNSSAGKDSQAMLDYVAALAVEQDATDRLVVVHCDLGRVEWPGTKELAERQANHYGLPFRVVRNRNWGDLLDRIESRGQWPDMKNRYCTSEFKTGQVKRLATELVRQARRRFPYRQIRLLNCLGLRAQESPRRAKLATFRHLGGSGWSNSRRHVDEWLPIHDWTLDDVWARIRASGVEHHYAYDLGMPRLSCVFCVFASNGALQIAAKANPDLAAEYVAAEARMGHTFRNGASLADILGTEPEPANDWAA